MTVSEVTGRIAQIQTQLALLAPRTGDAAGAFGTTLQRTQASGTTGLAGDATPAGAAGGRTPGAVTGEAVAAEAQRYLGVPYVWGGTSPEGLDCSGLVQLVYRNLGYDLPRVSNQQATSGRPVAGMDQAQPGDLLAWDNSGRNTGADHIAIYLGGGMMIEAPRPGLEVRITEVPDTPDAIRRIVGDAPVAATWSSRAQVASGTPYASLFEGAAARHGVPSELLAAVARQESAFDPRAVSPAGAQGLMQLMPATARGLGVEDPFDPAQAVDGAARLLRDLLDRFGRTDLALAAYNAGPGAVLRYDGIPPYPETRSYVSRILADLEDSR